MYRIIGADGQEYGPVGAEELRRWIAEGRANAHSRVLAEGAAEWRPLGELPEFTVAPGTPTPPGRELQPGAGLSKFALAGFILSLLGFCCCVIGLPVSLAGLIFSCLGLSRVNRAPGLAGRGLAIAGIVLGIAGVFVSTSILVVLIMEMMEIYN